MASAHLTHLNTAHLLFNLAGLFLLCELLWQDLPVRHGAGLLAVAGSGVSLLLWWLQPEVAWYAGLSGALHGLWAGCALAGIRPRTAQPDSRSHVAGAAGIALLALKLALEYRYGASSHTARAIGAPVLVVSHWYGALSGACYVMVWRLVRRLRRGTDSAPHFD
jgi:rhomboid family GlyGly-CTERM serine protease